MTAKVNRWEILHTGRVFQLVSENVTLENGTTVDLDLIRHPGAAAVIPIRDDQCVVMIRQYRHAVGGYIWEIPAGTLDAGETPMDCARRELVEETGFSASTWEKMGEMTPVPGYSNERIHLYLASSLTPARQRLDPDELLQVHQVPLSRAIQWVHTGSVQDGKTICGLLLAATRLNPGSGGP